MNLKYSIILILISTILASCANIVTPSGGLKDESPPFFDTIYPPNKTLNFNQSMIEFRFNEFIEQSTILNNIIVNPPLINPIKIKVSGKTLFLNFNESLLENTTYTVNFGDGIKDITEQNIASNLTYVFSTGNKIDSASIKGNIVNANTLLPEPNTLVLIYPAGEDSLFLTSKPNYFSKTDKSGSFEIKNIKPAEYQVYGLLDQNNNYYYDLPNESIAFKNENIKIDSLHSQIDLKLFQENNIKQKLISVKSYRYGQTIIAFSKSTDSVLVKYIGDSSETTLFEKTQKKDTILFWNSNSYLTKHLFKISYQEYDTLIESKVKSIPLDSNLSNAKNPFVCNAKKLSKGNIINNDPLIWDIDKNIIFTFQNPIISIDSSAFLIIDDSTKQTIKADVFIDSLKTNVVVSASFESNKKYVIKIFKNATTDLFNLTNDSSTYYIKTKDKKDYGSIIVHLENTISSPCILYLLNSKIEVVATKQIASNQKSHYTFEFLVPDNYKLKIVEDKNENGFWDTGKLNNKRQPENVYFYSAEVISKANWEVELDWELK